MVIYDPITGKKFMENEKQVKEAQRRLDKLLREYNDDCQEISEVCVEEGYPSHGSNYDLRCEDLWNSFYKGEYDRLEKELEGG